MKYPIKRNLTSLGFYTQKVVSPVFKVRGFMEGKIITHWSQVVGDQMAQMALPEKITFPKGKRIEGTLHLHVTSSGALLLHYAQDLLLEQINTFFGYKALSKLRMIHGFSPSREISLKTTPPSLSQTEKDWLKEQTSSVIDEDLQACLESLGKTLCLSK